ncbi:MAG: ribbon-helix-helix domain-containing protein [Rhodospirillaceae bacterium]|jgi:predicted DNA-binding ribbon-helix-helix protein
MSLILKRSINIAGHPTSISLEEEFWEALKQIARDERCSLPDLVAKIDKERTGGLSSALRLHVLKTLQNGTQTAANAVSDSVGD